MSYDMNRDWKYEDSLQVYPAWGFLSVDFDTKPK